MIVVQLYLVVFYGVLHITCTLLALISSPGVAATRTNMFAGEEMLGDQGGDPAFCLIEEEHIIREPDNINVAKV